MLNLGCSHVADSNDKRVMEKVSFVLRYMAAIVLFAVLAPIVVPIMVWMDFRENEMGGFCKILK